MGPLPALPGSTLVPHLLVRTSCRATGHMVRGPPSMCSTRKGLGHIQCESWTFPADSGEGAGLSRVGATGAKDGERKGGRGLRVLGARDGPLQVRDSENLLLPHGDLSLDPRRSECPERHHCSVQSQGRGQEAWTPARNGSLGLLLPSGVGGPHA